MNAFVVAIWLAVTGVILCVGLCLVAVCVYAGAFWNWLKRERKEPRPPRLERWQQQNREFVGPAVVAASRKRQDEIAEQTP
jgi:hypothetical protein